MLFAIVATGQTYPTLGKIDTYDNSFAHIVASDQKIEILTDSLKWAEGPVWVPEQGYLLCSDPTRNTMYKWSSKDGVQVFLSPSGYTGLTPYSDEPGSNGLLINHEGELVACEHGDRRITRMPLDKGGKVTVADSWDGKRFNSPNDICQHSDGSYYFTDPPYGLPDGDSDVANREINQDGVYKASSDGTVIQIIADVKKPNGIALSPDESILYVGLSNPKKPYLLAYPLKEGKINGSAQVLFDFSSQFPEDGAAPDGFKVDANGNIFIAAGKGVVVIDKTGKLLGRIHTGVSTANCAFGSDNWLYITASNYLLRVQLLDQSIKMQ
ncbi:SMP-30/gluconolactonase/LRE family protein [Sphingobacterium sp. lm-10]|uniref:SMP-30/gluconolactonase/LRE family protein n=1 Tax=Sphingobacterium sp. lm-10 TaxID=2944904 RepID=UPI00202289DE|nr:SMP-30/gluconolactonase/LRE family protein [Sphingobacterium sp. lm-10]MCL7986690.1 SMP-30/gluconolactonase/LRE family protein [Sphingobacterium sp. lm-10]